MNHGSEWTRRIYRKEEEFLEDWYETVDAPAALRRRKASQEQGALPEGEGADALMWSLD